MARIPEEWKLSPSQHLEIFNNEIAPREILPHLDHQQLQDTNPDSSIVTNKRPPLAIIIVGQTGAGKTRLAPDLLQAMNTLTSSSSSSSNSNPQEHQTQSTTATATAKPRPTVHLIADTYKTYHPHYKIALSSSTPHLASPLTSPSARSWLTMACTLCAEHTLPVLLESACRHPDDFIQLASIFHKSGYTVLVAILAVPAALSRLGILVRYHRDLPEAKSRGLPLRLTPRKVHDDSYEGLEQAAQWVDRNEEDAVDGVVVVRRGGGVAYSNRRTYLGLRGREEKGDESDTSKGTSPEEGNNDEGGRAWVKEPGALRALIHERERELSTEEVETARRDIELLRRLHDPKVDEEIRQIEELLARLGREQQGLPELDRVFDASWFVREYCLDR